MKKEIIYSIIIPHKNIPKLLQRCLDSIPQREDLEIIIVDDNSDPRIVNFDKFPGGDRDDVITIFDKDGSGAGHARNLGLERAQGEKLLFVDADDYFNYCIREVLDEYKEDETDLVFFNMSSADSDLYTVSIRAGYLQTIYQLRETSEEKALFLMRYSNGSSCSKLIKHSVVKEHKIKFDETPIHNDTRFAYLVGFYSKTHKMDPRAIYCATYRGDSISFKLDDEKILKRVEILAKRDAFFRDHGIRYDNLVDIHIFSMASYFEAKNEGLYTKAVKIFEEEGFSKKEVSQRVEKEISRRKRARRKRKIKNILKSLLKVFTR